MRKWLMVIGAWMILSGFEAELTKEWSFSCDSGTSGNVFTNEESYIVVCGTEGVPEEIVSLTKEGETEWNHGVEGVVQPVFEKEGDRLWMVSEAREEGFDYILDVETGEKSAPLTFDFPDSIIIGDRTFMKAVNGQLHVFGGADWHAIDQSGERAFTFTESEQLLPDLSWSNGSYYVADDGAFSEDPYIYKVDTNGRVTWKKSAALDELPLFTNEYLWFTEPFAGVFHTLNPESGETISEKEGNFYHRLLMNQPLLMENHLFTSSDLYQLSPEGDVKWKTNVTPYRIEEYMQENDLSGDQWLLQERNIASSDSFRVFSQNVYFYNEQNKEVAALTKLYEDGSFAWTNRTLPTIYHTEVIDSSIFAAGEGHVSLLNQRGAVTDTYPVEGEVTHMVKEGDGVVVTTPHGLTELSVSGHAVSGINDFLPDTAVAQNEKASVSGSKVWKVQFNTALAGETALKNIAVVNEFGEVIDSEKTLSEDGTEITVTPPTGEYEPGDYAITVHDRISSPYGKLLKEEVYQVFEVR